jgi:hypothetical protein
MRECVEMLGEIIERGVGLTDWETNFIDDVADKDTLSSKQREIIDRIHDEKVQQ